MFLLSGSKRVCEYKLCCCMRYFIDAFALAFLCKMIDSVMKNTLDET